MKQLAAVGGVLLGVHMALKALQRSGFVRGGKNDGSVVRRGENEGSVSGVPQAKFISPVDHSFFVGKTVLVTGCSRGLGLEFCTQLLQAGAKVIATCRSIQTATDLEALVSAHQGSASLYEMDVSNWASIERAMKTIAEEVTSIDVVINNAGGC